MITLYHGTTHTAFSMIRSEGYLNPKSRIGIFAGPTILPFLEGMRIPPFAEKQYTFCVPTPYAGERYYLSVPEGPFAPNLRHFLKEFINKRRDVVLEFKVDRSNVFVVDFYHLAPWFDPACPSPRAAFEAYLASFIPLEKYAVGTYRMPEVLVDCPIPLGSISTFNRGPLDSFFQEHDSGVFPELPSHFPL